MQFLKEMKAFLFLLLISSLFGAVYGLDPDTIRNYIKYAERRYLETIAAVSDTLSTPDYLTSLQIALQAIIRNSKRIRHFLLFTKPCTEQVLTSICKNLELLEQKIASLVDRIMWIISLKREEIGYKAPTVQTGEVGRPKYIIPKEQLETMRQFKFSWTDIAKALGVGISTIWRLRLQYGIEQGIRRKEQTLSGRDLNEFISQLQMTTPNIGITMIEGAIRAKDLYASRKSISEALVQMDPAGAMLRWNEQNQRVKYSVPGPNSLWHLDGNHKLIRWKFVVHAAIDGYSRLLVFINCATNNLSSTVADLFLQATVEYCWPSRLRTDKGAENVQVARMMVEKRGEGRGSILQGSSVHNQRIERLWRDMRHMVTEYFRQLFYFLENQGLLNVDDSLDMFTLHYVYLNRINASLSSFKGTWNSHKLSTEHSKTPHQLYILGMLNLFGSEYRAVKDFFENNTVDEGYGIEEPDGDELVEDASDNVVVPPVELHVPDECLTELQERVNPLFQDGNHGISTYVLAKRIVSRHCRT